jgi:hypothetical protein
MSESVRQTLIPPAGQAKVLLHSCCAPCSSEVMEAMLASGIDHTILFYNPNIHPELEYRPLCQRSCRLNKIGTMLTTFTDGCPRLRRILLDAGVPGLPILDWFHRAMRMRHLTQIAEGSISKRWVAAGWIGSSARTLRSASILACGHFERLANVRLFT